MSLDAEVKEMADSLGADFFGVADLAPAKEAILDQGGPAVAGFPRGISIGVALPHAIVDQLPNRDQIAVARLYRHHAYDVINIRLDHIASRIGGFLQREGHRTLPIQAAQRVDDKRHLGLVSNKLSAHLSGLGWIGKSCLLVTPENGPRVRWITVLTEAPLSPTGKPMEVRCEDCRECVDICPVQAFTGRQFREDEHRDLRFDTQKCDEYQQKLKAEMGVGTCGMCLYVCPHGRNGDVQ
jgi:epoxyqueuosine reductase QueG